MSAIDKLVQMALVNVFKDLPPEIQQHLTPQGMQLIGEKVGKTLDFFMASQMAQVEQNKAILLNQQILMEAHGVGSKYSAGPNITRSEGDGGSNSDAGSIAA